VASPTERELSFNRGQNYLLNFVNKDSLTTDPTEDENRNFIYITKSSKIPSPG